MVEEEDKHKAQPNESKTKTHPIFEQLFQNGVIAITKIGSYDFACLFFHPCRSEEIDKSPELSEDENVFVENLVPTTSVTLSSL